MKKQSLLILLASICLTLMLGLLPFMSACSPSTTTEATTTGKTEIKLLGLPLGYTGYTLTFGLSDIINKNSDKLKATFEVSSGTYSSQIYVMKNPAAWKDTFFFSNQATVWMSEIGWEPLEGVTYFDFRCVAKSVTNPNTFVTLDPNIKTLEDLEGKRIGVGPLPSSIYAVPKIILDYLGLTDKVKISNMSFNAIKDALLSGTIDVGWLSWSDMGGGTLMGTTACDELMRTKQTYVIPIPIEVGEAVEEAYGCWLGTDEWNLPATGPTPAQTFTAPVAANSWWVHKDMESWIVEEVLQQLYDHIYEMAFYDVSGEAMKREYMARLPIMEDSFHPGAIKFYGEKGIELGWREWDK
jgi:TRAP transporter TAXI family solute receptor